MVDGSGARNIDVEPPTSIKDSDITVIERQMKPPETLQCHRTSSALTVRRILVAGSQRFLRRHSMIGMVDTHIAPTSRVPAKMKKFTFTTSRRNRASSFHPGSGRHPIRSRRLSRESPELRRTDSLMHLLGTSTVLQGSPWMSDLGKPRCIYKSSVDMRITVGMTCASSNGDLEKSLGRA